MSDMSILNSFSIKDEEIVAGSKRNTKKKILELNDFEEDNKSLTASFFAESLNHRST